MGSVQDLSEPTVEHTFALFESIEQKFPNKSLGEDKWYLVALAALVGSTEPLQVATLYQYLIAKPEFSTPDSRKALMKRLREALVKCVSVVGVCKPLEAVFAISKMERPEDKDYSFSREKWQSGPENRERGLKWLGQIYQHNHAKTEETLSAHKDIMWLSEEITYGLYLSDHSILGPIETELVVLSGIMIQNLPLETAWHLRGSRRVGISNPDIEIVQQCIEAIATFSHLRLNKVPRVADIEHEV